MKKFFILFFAFFTIIVNCKAEKLSDQNDYDFKSNLNPNKTLYDAYIENYYKRPEGIEIVENDCKEILTRPVFDYDVGMVPNLHRSNLCTSWELNKNLTDEQRELVAKVRKIWEDIILDLYQKKDVPVDMLMGDTDEYGLQFTVRITNLVNNTHNPECHYEMKHKPNKFFAFTLPCNDDSPIKRQCHDNIECLKESLQKDFLEKTDPGIASKAEEHIARLIASSAEMYKSLTPESAKYDNELAKLFNFYNLIINYIHKDIEYYINHD